MGWETIKAFPVQGAMGGRAGGRQVMGGIIQLSRVESTSAPITARLKPPDRVRSTREYCAREASPSCGYGRADQQAQRVPRGVPTRQDHAIFVRTPNTLDRSPQLCPRETVAAQSRPPKNVADEPFLRRAPAEKPSSRNLWPARASLQRKKKRCRHVSWTD